MAGCCVFLRWPSTLPSLLGYRFLDDSKVTGLSSPVVTVVVEKEWYVFSIDYLMLDSYPSRLLRETAVRKDESKATLFVNVTILFLSVLCAK
uniref:Uncharacterized protein n=1 Tax=Oryza rufipogon TaxID=4529 RepID=A0A0E0RGV1_ORYRU